MYLDWVRPAVIGFSVLLVALFAGSCAGVPEELLPGGQAAGAGGAGDAELSDGAIRQLIIADSIAAYDGPCPCPYNVAADGKQCGARSAYTRQGGAAPICFSEQVTDDMVEVYREQH